MFQTVMDWIQEPNSWNDVIVLLGIVLVVCVIYGIFDSKKNRVI